MTTITKAQALARWELLTPPLREALVEKRNSDIIWQTCEAEHLADEKIHIVARLAGWVFLGFVHAEDLANEIKDALQIHPDIARRIADSLAKRLFAPLRTEIDTMYAPAGAEGAGRGPRLVEEIRRPEDVQKTLEKIGGVPGEPFFKEPPVSLADVPIPAEKIPATPPAGAVAPAPEGVPFGEAAAPADTGEAPSPFILRDEIPRESPAKETAGFHLDLSPDRFGASKLEFEAPLEAKIEVAGGEAPPAAPAPKPKSESSEETRVVHYVDEFRTPLDSFASTAPEPKPSTPPPPPLPIFAPEDSTAPPARETPAVAPSAPGKKRDALLTIPGLTVSEPTPMPTPALKPDEELPPPSAEAGTATGAAPKNAGNPPVPPISGTKNAPASQTREPYYAAATVKDLLQGAAPVEEKKTGFFQKILFWKKPKAPLENAGKPDEKPVSPRAPVPVAPSAETPLPDASASPASSTQLPERPAGASPLPAETAPRAAVPERAAPSAPAVSGASSAPSKPGTEDREAPTAPPSAPISPPSDAHKEEGGGMIDLSSLEK